MLCQNRARKRTETENYSSPENRLNDTNIYVQNSFDSGEDGEGSDEEEDCESESEREKPTANVDMEMEDVEVLL